MPLGDTMGIIYRLLGMHSGAAANGNEGRPIRFVQQGKDVWIAVYAD